MPFYGKYKEILNSDAVEFGGSGKGNPRGKTCKQEEYDGKENSLVIDLPPMCTLVFSCTPMKPPVKKAETGKKAKPDKEAKSVKAAKGGREEKTARPEKGGKEQKAAKPEKAAREKKAKGKAK